MAKIDQIQLMKVVLAIHDKGSLTKAAEKLNTSLPTVVRQLASLEAHLGVVLLDRTTRKNHLTNEGALYVEAARNIVKDAAALELRLNNRKNSFNDDALQANIYAPAGHMVITAPVMFGGMHVMPVVNAFMAKYCQITAQVLLQDTLTDLVEEGIDVAFRIGEITLQDVIATSIGMVHRVVCVSPQYLASHAAIKTPNDLKQENCIKNTLLNKGNHWKFNVKGKVKDIAVPITFTSNNMDATITHCVAGLGVGVFLSYQVKNLIQQGKLVEVLQEFRTQGLPVSMLYPKAKRHLARTSFFIDYAKESLIDAF
jgi:DNA-binding transcriptional LysR family regulator